jgi:hypothetical protein
MCKPLAVKRGATLYGLVLFSHFFTLGLLIALMMEEINISETSAYLYDTTWYFIPEDSRLNNHRQDNLKSHYYYLFANRNDLLYLQ